MQPIHVQSAPFDMGHELNSFREQVKGAGAIVTFCGITRDVAGGDLVAMEIEHYPGMTECALETIRAKAITRFDLAGAMIVHRYGVMAPNDAIMMVATAARHRAAAFEGAEFLMDYLKSRAPFWKKEITQDGATWVDAKPQDETALSRWNTGD